MDALAAATGKGVAAALEEFSIVCALNVEASAGSGSFNGLEQSSTSFAYRRSWLNKRGLDDAHLVVVYAKGDSMEPVIQDGSSAARKHCR